ncbi:hypothetical protein MKY96_32905 [Paenibacillus sp. FSL R7-0302]|uniref:hypothetical protein n=1 Tax=Paenibacillus sp. FSL R7-0302 TaxID=2921681 RepID=UPI0030F4BB16
MSIAENQECLTLVEHWDTGITNINLFTRMLLRIDKSNAESPVFIELSDNDEDEILNSVGMTLAVDQAKLLVDSLSTIVCPDSDKRLWSFYWDCGRAGSLDGMFVATEAEVNAAIGHNVNFGEVLGKHSEIYGTIDEGDITEVQIDPASLEKVSAVLGRTWSGINPLDSVNFYCEECGDEFDADRLNEDGYCPYCAAELEGDEEDA